jgi:hypothetical protein
MDFQIVFPGNGRKEPDSLWKTIVIGRQLLPKRQNRTNPDVLSSTRPSDHFTVTELRRPCRRKLPISSWFSSQPGLALSTPVVWLDERG